MNNFLRFVILPISLTILLLGFNHIKFGNSNSTLSIYEGLERELALVSYRSKGKNLADQFYKRIKHYQKYDGWYDRTIGLYYNWEKLQKEK